MTFPNFRQPAFWEAAWEQVRRDSTLKDSQTQHPNRWETFYDRVAPIWEDLWGQDTKLGEKVAEALLNQGLVGAKDTVLELGCGPGTLALALARKGKTVTALDQSAGMIACLRNRVLQCRLENLRVEQGDWRDFRLRQRHDLVLAAFFPPVMEPAGIKRLESFSKNRCLVGVNAGRDAFRLRREIWEAVMDIPCPDPGSQLPCLVNWLLSTGRKPNLLHLDWPARFSMPWEKAFDFFRHYFALFQRKSRRQEQTIRRILKSYETGGAVEVDGEVHLALVWWTRPRAVPRKRKAP
jgi:SAM-dependent methyltransferase